MKFKPSLKAQLPVADYLTRTQREPFFRIPTSPRKIPPIIPSIPDDIRSSHAHIIGKTGYGKTTLLAHQALRDIHNRQGGVCVIDPKGGIGALAEIVSRYVPEDRLDDCIWLDINNPIPLDIISCDPGKEEAVVKDLGYILSRGELDKGSAPELSMNIDNVIYTLLNANQNPNIPEEDRCTFIDIYRFFSELERQKTILEYVKDTTLLREWRPDRYPKDVAINRILTRINEFVRSTTMRLILGEPKPRLNIEKIINDKKILLVTVPDEHPSSSFYGSLLVSKIQHAAFSSNRSNIPEDERLPFYLFIDEFEYFRASREFSKMLKMARSFKLCLTLANLQLQELDADVVAALGIISTFILLKIDARDKTAFSDIVGAYDPGATLRAKEKELMHEWSVTQSESSRTRLRIVRRQLADYPDTVVTIDDAVALSRFEAIYKIGDAAPIKAPTPEPPPKRPTKEQIEKLETIRKNTSGNYGPTDANYGRILTKRTGDNAALLSRQVLQDEVNGQEQRKSEEIAPSGGANIPLD